MKNKLEAYRRRMTRLVRALCCWMRANGRSVWSLCAHLPRYLSAANHPIRAELAPTTPRLLLGRKQWISARRWELPGLMFASWTEWASTTATRAITRMLSSGGIAGATCGVLIIPRTLSPSAPNQIYETTKQLIGVGWRDLLGFLIFLGASCP